MSDLPCLPLWVDAYEADTGHLTDVENGRYLKLLMLLWRSPECRIPDDDGWLARHMRRSIKAVQQELRPLIEEFCQTDGGFISQKRLRREWEKALVHREKKRSAANVRWDREKGERVVTCSAHADAYPTEMQTYQQRIVSVDAPFSYSNSNHNKASSKQFPQPPSPKPKKSAPLNEVLALCDALGASQATDVGIATRVADELANLRAEGLDLERHILPAAREAIAKGAKVKSLNYLRPRATELRAAETSRPVVDYVPTDDDGWRNRIRSAKKIAKAEGVKKCWGGSWGPRPGEPGCQCPPEILQAEGYPT